MIRTVPVPKDPTAQGAAEFEPRWEDIAQDGRLCLEALPHAQGEVVWRSLMRRYPGARALLTNGVVPILTRMVLEGGAGPFSVNRKLRADGSFQLAHSLAADRTVDKIYLNMWTTAVGPHARTYDPQPDDAGGEHLAGRIFAEHVFTRPFAPPDERKVRTLPSASGEDMVPQQLYQPQTAEELLTLPPDARPLDPALELDPLEVSFGLMHTDSNQHVNSLVYPRMFEEAVLRRLHRHGVGTARLARSLEVLFRKPCFAGDRVRIALRAFALGDAHGAVGVVLPAREIVDGVELRKVRPHTTLCMMLET